ncbi:hypothetical protein [Streptomyces scabiei]|nr:hypothetical protein [Streptomyces scabiei]
MPGWPRGARSSTPQDVAEQRARLHKAGARTRLLDLYAPYGAGSTI